MKPVVRPRARADIIRQFRWYLVENNAPDVAFRFLDAVDKAVKQLLRMPRMGMPRKLKNRMLEGLRNWPVPGFEDIRIFYIAEGKMLRVIRVLHGKRDIRNILENEPADIFH